MITPIVAIALLVAGLQLCIAAALIWALWPWEGEP